MPKSELEFIEDDDSDFYRRQDYLDQIRESAIAEFNAPTEISDEGNQVFKFLPIRYQTRAESDYIQHLWQAFLALDRGEGVARPFVLMPFHLLFLLAIQYRILRISVEVERDYALAFTFKKLPQLPAQASVFDIALLQERMMPDLFRLISVEEALISRAKEMIDFRNETLAHAKGGIEQNPLNKVGGYLAILKELQPSLGPLNDVLAKKWSKELKDKKDIANFTESRLAQTYLCPVDFESGLLHKRFPLTG